jgi:hypothetical protein
LSPIAKLGDLEYLQVERPVFNANQKKEIIHVVGTRSSLSGHADEAETIHSEDKPISEVIARSESVNNVLTYSDAKAANLDVAIAVKVVYAIFGGREILNIYTLVRLQTSNYALLLVIAVFV